MIEEQVARAREYDILPDYFNATVIPTWLVTIDDIIMEMDWDYLGEFDAISQTRK